VPAACVNQVVRISDVLEWKRLADRYRQRTVAGGGRDVCGGLFFGLARKVIAAEKSDRHVVEEHGPEGKGGSVLAARVSGDDCTDLADGGIEVDVVGEGDLDDPVNAGWRDGPDVRSGIRPIERDDVVDHPCIDVNQVFAAPDRADDGGPAPAGPTPPRTPCTSTVAPATGPSPNTAR
jgi:hypothetical protein